MLIALIRAERFLQFSTQHPVYAAPGRGRQRPWLYVEAYQESNPSVRGSFVQWMPTGKSWRFHHWIWRGNAYLDDYREFSTTGLTWSPDERLIFAYDHLDRLTSAAPESGGQGYSQAFQYNAVGNLTSFAGTAYAYNDAAHKHAVTHLGGVQKYWYDANGNMTTRIENGVTYQQAWDYENRLASVTGNGTTTFTYDGDGARVKKVDASGTTVYAGAVEVLINATQRITRTYYSAGTQLVAMRVVTSTGGNALYYLHTDHLGSTSLTTNSSGGEVARQKYYPYGQIRPGGTGSMPTDVGFTGQRLDTYIKLIQMGARWYDPAIGRWISPDTIVPNPANPQSLNRYSYVYNNPLKYVDPSGHYVCSGYNESWGDATCYEIINQWLDYLQAHGGDVGADLVKRFWESDANWPIKIEFIDELESWGQTDARFGKLIQIQNTASLADEQSVLLNSAFFGHEVHHLVNQQHAQVISSAYGEKEAYDVTWTLLENMGFDPETHATDLFKDIHNASYSDEDLLRVQEITQAPLLRPAYADEPLISGTRVAGGVNTVSYALGVAWEGIWYYISGCFGWVCGPPGWSPFTRQK